MFESKIIDQIIEAWAPDALARNDLEMAQAVPNAVDLKAMLELAFLASLKREEGEPIKFRLVLLPATASSNLHECFPGPIKALPFAERLQFSVEEIRKLAPAFDQDSTALAVAKRGDAYEIVGALLYGRMTSRLEVGGGGGRPQALTLSSRVSGNVIVGFGDSVLGRFQDGNFSLAKPTWTASMNLVRHIIGEISGHEQHKKHRGEYWYLYRDCLERLYITAAKAGHGGIIVWMPADNVARALADVSGGVRVSLRWSGSYFAGNVLERMVKPEDGQILADCKKQLADYLDMLSHLSFVDGAVLLDSQLQPHAFRVLLGGDWKGDVVEGPLRDQQSGEPIDISRLGSRHKSAVRFVGAHPGCVVFVISEDGPVRALCRLDDAVLFWPDCLNTVFLDS